MRRIKILTAVGLLAMSALGALTAHAATLTVGHYDGTTWTGDQSVLVVNGNALVANDASITGLSGTITLQGGTGPSGPEMIYALSVINTSAQTQSYSFSFGEAIATPISGATLTYADIAGGLSTRSGSGSASINPTIDNSIQRFELSSDGGLTFVSAGVDVGPGVSFSRTNTYGVYSALNFNGPAGQTWNYMRLVSSFNLAGNSTASLSGFASVTLVPEPSTGGMLLLGIGLIGTMARRRKVWP